MLWATTYLLNPALLMLGDQFGSHAFVDRDNLVLSDILATEVSCGWLTASSPTINPLKRLTSTPYASLFKYVTASAALQQRPQRRGEPCHPARPRVVLISAFLFCSSMRPLRGQAALLAVNASGFRSYSR